MLVVVSDLHLGDRTASENIAPRAFDLFLDHVTDLAEHARDPKLTLLFLGDIFDLLRTEHWFYPAPALPLTGAAPRSGEPYPPALRPWASAALLDDPDALDPRCRERALRIAEKVVAVAGPQLDILAGRHVPAHAVVDPALRSSVAAKVRRLENDRIYVPGNHDRLARIVPGIMWQLLASLRARLPTPEEERDPGVLALAGAALVARHGHEYDDWNFEPVVLGSDVATLADLRRTPVGDPLTTEVLAGLPFRVWQELVAAHVPAKPAGQPIPAWIDAVHAHLTGIEDVRPLGAVVRWVALSGVEAGRAGAGAPVQDVRDTVNRTARRIYGEFFSLPFTRAWRARRRRGPGFWTLFWMWCVRIVCALAPLRLVEGFLSIRVVRSAMEGDGTREAKRAQELLRRVDGAHVVFGHTHRYRQVPVRPGDEVTVYLNSGTWRPRVYEALDRKGFRKVKEMTYLVFHEGERPRYETWNGTKGA